MVRKALILLISALPMACSQSKKVLDVNVPYEGVIVDKDVNIFVDEKKEWFRPTLHDVGKAERLLVAQIEKLNKEKLNQGSPSCPIIHRNLNKYIRQYVGYIDTSGEKIILIICYGKKVLIIVGWTRRTFWFLMGVAITGK